MPKVPSPITSAPAVPGQPYDATAPGSGDDQSAQGAEYDGTGGSGASTPWPKVQEGGAADWRTGKVVGDWPGDGASDGSAWKQA